jgi:signal transduction histidine kinase
MEEKAKSLQTKLRKLIFTTSGLAILLASLVFFVFEYFTIREAEKQNLMTLAKIIASNSSAPLAFDDKKNASEILGAISAERRVTLACLYDSTGRIFAKFPQSAADSLFPRPVKAERVFYAAASLECFEPVLQINTMLGILYLHSDLGMIYSRFLHFLYIACFVVALSLGISVILSRQLQLAITRPILQLSDGARNISTKGDYSFRAEPSTILEANVLTDAFNQMLDRIETQNLAITKFNQELEHKIAERTHELAGMNQELMKSNEHLEQFAYITSHDLQEPLRKIQTFSEIVETRLGDPEFVQKYLGKIRTSALRMSDLVRSILDYSRITATQDNFSPTDLNAVLEGVKIDLEILIENKHATITSDGLPKMMALPPQIGQLFLNLISNSLKFSERDPVLFIHSSLLGAWDAESQQHGFGDGCLKLSFEDNGIGFEQQYADRIFNIFGRLHDPKKYPGTGVGLALCKKIVETHNGAIDVNSQVGQGTTITVYFPASLLI